MSEPKTKPTEVSVESHIAGIANEQQRKDAESLVVLMRSVTKQEPKMWGPSIVGFGDVDLKVLEKLVAQSVADTKSRYPRVPG